MRRQATWTLAAGLGLAALLGVMAAGQGPEVGGAPVSDSRGVALFEDEATEGPLICQEAPEVDPEWKERQEDLRERRMDDAVRKARVGKCAVVSVSKLKIGMRELVTATLESGDERRVVVVPSFLDKTSKTWQPAADLVKALEALPRGFYEVIHTEERYGIEWAVGVGDSSPEKLDELEKMVAGRKWRSTRTGERDEPKEAEGQELQKFKATGRFLELAESSISGVEAKMLVLEHGTMLKRSQFWLVQFNSRGKVVPLSKNTIRVVESLKPGDTVEIEYVQHEDVYLLLSLRKP